MHLSKSHKYYTTRSNAPAAGPGRSIDVAPTDLILYLRPPQIMPIIAFTMASLASTSDDTVFSDPESSDESTSPLVSIRCDPKKKKYCQTYCKRWEAQVP